MNLKTFTIRSFCIMVLFLFIINICFSQSQRDLVKGNLIQFNDNGAWCWYQDERAIVDITGNKIIMCSDASANGVGGSPRSGDLECVMFDLQTRTNKKYTLRKE